MQFRQSVDAVHGSDLSNNGGTWRFAQRCVQRQMRDVLASTLGLCSYCNERHKLTLDHIVPLSTGGEHDIDNAVPACNSCNSAKGKTPLVLWLVRRAA